jgi:adenine-specific DNA-methyltransferase
MPILHWLDRDKHVKAAESVPYRLLEADDAHSAGDAETSNMLIQGDNLEALKALLPYYAGRVKCIFIDPPYNTRSAVSIHYDDNLEHSQWLEMMYPRLLLLRELLAEDGSIWVTIDDNESHYLKVIMDEVFGRRNFIGVTIWEKSDSPRMDAVFFSSRHDNVLAFAKNIDLVLFKKLPSEEIPEHYNRTDKDDRRYYTKPLRAMGGQGETREARPTLYYPIEAPDGTIVYPKKQDGSDGAWRWNKEKVAEEKSRIDWVKGKKGWVPYYRIYADNLKDRPAETIWFHGDVGTNRTSKAEIKALKLSEAFDTPKPERLIQRILQIATNTGDLVLDSFLGSGTTAAVAHKMGRRYIGIEMGDHAVTLCAPRLKKVIEGEQGGISEAVGWKGGGGFRFYKLGAPVFDTEGRINPEIRFPHLAAHIWFSETHTALHKKARSALLGRHNGAAYYLLYNGILGDKRPDGGNVLTAKILAELPAHDGQKVIYGEACRIGAARLKDLGIVFKQTPYDVKAR